MRELSPAGSSLNRRKTGAYPTDTPAGLSGTSAPAGAHSPYYLETSRPDGATNEPRCASWASGSARSIGKAPRGNAMMENVLK